jgi:hypothetical protein
VKGRLGRREGHVKMPAVMVLTPCHDGIFKPKFLLFFPPSALSLILHNHNLFLLTIKALEKYLDGLYKALETLMMSLWLPRVPLFWFCLVR